MHAEEDTPIATTALSFEIVEELHDLDGATLPDLVDRFDTPKSTIHDHLQTLSKLGYVVRDGRTYRVSVRFLNLGGLARARSEFFQVAEREVRKLARETGEHANALVEENGVGIFLYKEKGPESVSLDTYEGMEVKLHTTALGKAILAEMDERTRSAVIDKHGLDPVTPKTITDRDELEAELAEIRDRGYAVDNEERLEGIRCVAAPVTAPDRVVGAVSVSAPRRRMSGDQFETEITSEVLRTANIVEVNLQHG